MAVGARCWSVVHALVAEAEEEGDGGWYSRLRARRDVAVVSCSAPVVRVLAEAVAVRLASAAPTRSRRPSGGLPDRI
jgi:hypothetical protein